MVLQIEKLQEQGVPLNEVAVIYAQHKQADNIISLMEKKGLPYNVKKPVNILELPLVEQILSVLRYLEAEKQAPFSAEAVLFEILHAPFYGVAPADIASLCVYVQQNRSKDKALGYWRLLLTNDLLLESLNLQTSVALRRLGANINSWLQLLQELPLPLLIEKIVYESGIVPYILQGKDKVWNTQVLHTFFSFVKDVYDRNPRAKVKELLAMTERMQDEQIPLPLHKIVQHEHGVHFFTAHGAKGNEFEYVFLIGATKNFWENKRGGGNEYKLPDTITNTREDADKSYKTEVARRLFYVALTRAKKHLQVSYAVKDNGGKALETSCFVDEISTPEERINETVETPALLRHMEWAMMPVPDVRIELANYQYIERVLQQFTMSYTTLSKYLKCPVSFYYECILKVPFLKGDALSFGSAVHHALERMFLQMQENQGTFPPLEDVLKAFDSYMFRERDSFTRIQMDRRTEQGHSVLSDYYNNYLEQFATNVAIELKVPRYLLDGVPVTGKIDKLEFDGNQCVVVDYKTGDPDKSVRGLTSGPSEKDPNGGDYWRQMVFYKLLLENWKEKDWKVTMGVFDFVEKGRTSNEYRRIQVPVFPQDETTVRQQLKESWSRIMNHEFDSGCNSPDCYWCNFTRKYELVRPRETEALVELDDI